MPTLPKLPYTDNGTKTSVTAFTGITKIGDGALYDGLNMCSDYYPNIATRKGFAKVGLESGLDFDCKAVTPLADGSGLLFIGASKAKLLVYSTGTVEQVNYGTTINNIAPTSVVCFKRQYEMSPTWGRTHTYKYTFSIVFIASAKFAIVWKTVEHDGETTNDLVCGVLDGKDKFTVGNPSSSFALLSTWFGQGNGDWSLDHGEPGRAVPTVNAANPPIYLTGEQSVISSSDQSLTKRGIPGLYLTVNKNGEVNNGLVLEKFRANGDVHLHLRYPNESTVDVDYESIVFANGAGFQPNERNQALEDGFNMYLYYSPPGLTTVDSHDYKTYSTYYDIPDDIRGAFISGNRMWVYDEHSIYASWLGQFELFTVDGTDNGGWSVTLPGTKLITGGIEYGGRPVFFTEDSIITVYGGYPSAFSTRIDEAWGVEYGSEQSLQLCAGSLYYLSKAGVMRYSGNVPVCISNDLTRYQLNNGRAGADGRHYYLYAENLARDGDSVTTEAFIYVWDVIRQSWHKWQYTGACGWNDSISAGGTLIANPIFTYVKYEPEDVSHVLFVNGTDKGVYAVPSYDRQKLIPGAIIRDGYFGYNDSRRWDIRLGRFYMNTTNMKILKGVHLRARLLSQPRCKPDGGQDRAARFYVRICYDDANAALDEYPIDVKTGFEEIHTENQPQNSAVAGEIYAERNIYIPIQNRRYESFWLDISGRERWEFSGLAFEYEASGRT